jgi:hypothetical protein
VLRKQELAEQARRNAQQIAQYLQLLNTQDRQESGSDARAEDVRRALRQLRGQRAEVQAQLENGEHIAALDAKGITSYVAVNRAVNNQGDGTLHARRIVRGHDGRSRTGSGCSVRMIASAVLPSAPCAFRSRPLLASVASVGGWALASRAICAEGQSANDRPSPAGRAA